MPGINPTEVEALAWTTRMQSVADAVASALRGGAPPPVMVSIAEDRITITPWLPGAPISAVVAWSNFLDARSWSAVVHEPIVEGSRPLSSLYCVGTLDDLPVEIIGSASYRQLDGLDMNVRGSHQPLDPRAVLVEAAREEPVDLTPEPTP